MSDIAIKVEGLGKKYQIRHQSRVPYQTFREALVQKCASLWRPQHTDSSAEDFWALKDVSFKIKRGECVGIIGRNGAGKSTLLKVLSRITEPTTGRITLHGRVASLLEVGTGFHQELTGRENIYLNGTILGMKKKEIDRKFDEIVSFAEIEKFLDTPVKRYSSGMYVRLAFAVAAHLEPEILVVDEVLAVGDVQFQEKCIGKMKDVAGRQNRTVLFVSHNMQAIRTLFSRVVLLENGQLSMDGGTPDVIQGYSALMKERKIDATTDIRDPKIRRGEGAIRFTSIEVTDDRGRPTFHFLMGDTIHFHFTYETYKNIKGIRLAVLFKGGQLKETVTSVEHQLTLDNVSAGSEGVVTLVIPNIALRPGEYPLYFTLMDECRTSKNCDVLDEGTLPITVGVRDSGLFNGFDTRMPLGYLSIPSMILENQLLGAKDS